MKAGGQFTGTTRRAKGIDAVRIEEVGGLLELGNLADEYAREIQRSPFSRPFDWTAPDAGLASPFPGTGCGWHPSHLLRDEKLRQQPNPSIQFSCGLLSTTDGRRQRERIERQHREVLARQFIADRDAHPAYRRLRTIAGFRSVLEEFAKARNPSRPKLDSPLRAPQAEAQMLSCIVRSLWRLSAKDWRPAPTKRTKIEARKAARVLMAAGKEGLHSLPSYWSTVHELRKLLDELEAPTGRKRAPKLDEHTARRETLAAFEDRLAAIFGKQAFDADMRGVRRAYAALLGFQNPNDKVSP
jgi:hypothetical protein